MRSVQYEIHLHANGAGGELDQDQEWCEVAFNGSRRRIRFHDYGEIFALPGLYEQLFYDQLRCTSPQTVVGLLSEQLTSDGAHAGHLTALDVGAGNGMVGEELRSIGVSSVTGVDLIPEAAVAAHRDRPGIYADYRVVDLTELPESSRKELEARRFNCLTCVAALGFGDMPPAAFAAAYDLILPGGWLAFNIKEDFLDGGSDSGFSGLIRTLVDHQAIEVRAQKRYRHRLSIAGDPLHYVATVAVKRDGRPARAL